MAIGIAAQFDLLLRQKDVIGEWVPSQPDVAGADLRWCRRDVARALPLGQHSGLEVAAEDVEDPQCDRVRSAELLAAVPAT
jgi:hypothetical protein